VNVTTQTGPFAIIADDEELGRLLMSESMIGTGLEPLAFDNGLAALGRGLVARSRDHPAGCRHAGYGRLLGLPAPSRRAATRHSPHCHGHRP